MRQRGGRRWARRGSRWRVAAPLLVLFVASGLGGCLGAEGAAGGAGRAGTLVLGSIGDAATLNPLYATEETGLAVIGLVFDGLLGVDPATLEPEPALAERWEVSEDGLRYTFHLREGVRWSDGEPFDAEDVRFTYETFADPETANPRLSDFEMIASVETPDPRTAVIRLKRVHAPFLLGTAAAYPILPEHLLRGIPPTELKGADFGRKPVGTGPYRLVERRTGESFTLERNPDYWQGSPRIPRIVIRVVPDQNAMVAQLLSGEIDLFDGLRPEDLPAVQRRQGLRTAEFEALQYTFLGFNLKRPYFADPRVRRAVTMAIDRPALVREVLQGHGEVANGPFPRRSWAHDPALPPLPYDVVAARRLLDEAGWIDRDGDGVRERDGVPFRFSLQTNQGNKTGERLAVIIQQQLREVGIDARPELLEWSTFIERHIQPGDFDAVILAWSLAADPDNSSIFHSAAAPPGLNSGWYANPEVDRLLEEAARTPDLEERKRLYADLQRVMQEDPPYAFLYFRRTIVGYSSRLHLAEGEGPAAFTDVHTWWLEP